MPVSDTRAEAGLVPTVRHAHVPAEHVPCEPPHADSRPTRFPLDVPAPDAAVPGYRRPEPPKSRPLKEK